MRSIGRNVTNVCNKIIIWNHILDVKLFLNHHNKILYKREKDQSSTGKEGRFSETGDDVCVTASSKTPIRCLVFYIICSLRMLLIILEQVMP